ncbi:hypothetical protein [Subtercola vilae]|uniref:hypothetical protein n=1 Tax=Subtercola vilae TaxID=2056433 RepID=UPI0010A99984|nr:hypothetical protein [Subtercola vilae]
MTTIIMVLLIIFRRQYAELTAKGQRAMFGSVGERVARNSTPAMVLFIAVAGLLFATFLMTASVTNYEYAPPSPSPTTR